jgi:hypothetical protein
MGMGDTPTTIITGQKANVVFTKVKTGMDAWLTRKKYPREDIDGFLKTIDSVAGHTAFQGKQADEIQIGFERVIGNLAKAPNGDAKITSLHIKLTDIAPDTLTGNLLNATRTPELKPVNDNVVSQLRDNIKRNKADEAARKIKKAPGFLDLPLEHRISVGITGIFAGLLLADGLMRVWKSKDGAIDESGEKRPQYSQFAFGAINTLLGVGLGYLAHTNYRQALGTISR